MSANISYITMVFHSMVQNICCEVWW